MSESIFVGPITDTQEKIDLEGLKAAILEKWSEAVIRVEEGSEIPLRWDVLGKNWYIESRLIGGHTLAIRSNDPKIITEVILWFYNLNLQTEQYLYSPNTVSNLYRLTDNISEQAILLWLNNA